MFTYGFHLTRCILSKMCDCNVFKFNYVSIQARNSNVVLTSGCIAELKGQVGAGTPGYREDQAEGCGWSG